jgi:hypothetical protein
VNDDKLADIIVEVFDGVTVLDSSFGPIYVKHFHQLDTRKIFSKKRAYIKEAEGRGLMTEKESLDLLIKDKMWDMDSESEIQEKKKFIDNMKKSLTKIKLPSQREGHKKLIELEQDKLNKLSFEREKLVGLTAEKYVEKKVNQEFFESLLFSDKDLKFKIYDDISYDEMNKIREISQLEDVFFKKFSDDNISRSVLSPFFGPYLAYAEDVLGMFGTPLKSLTAFQLKILSYARSFLNIFKNTQKDIPEHVAKDPGLLLEFYESQKNNNNQRKTKASEGSGGTTYFGANKQDIESVKNSDEKVITLSDEIKKKGGKLDMKQMMELHGV